MEGSKEYSCTPPELKKIAEEALLKLLPVKSREKYIAAYNKFDTWRKTRKAAITDDVMLAYLDELGKIYKPPSLWSVYSMLKATIKIKNQIDISTFPKIAAYLKRINDGYMPNKANILTEVHIQRFLNEAPDQIYLATKAALIFGLMGTLRVEELTNIEMDQIEHHGEILLVKIPKTKTKIEKSFTISGGYYNIVKKYLNLRPENVPHKRVFVKYEAKNQKCSIQPIGKNKFSSMPREIANFLELPYPNTYTGHTFRRSSTSLLANAEADIPTIMRHGGWKSTAIAEQYVESSLTYKKRTGDLRASSIELNNKKSCPASPAKSNSEFPPVHCTMPMHQRVSLPSPQPVHTTLPKSNSKFQFQTPSTYCVMPQSSPTPAYASETSPMPVQSTFIHEFEELNNNTQAKNVTTNENLMENIRGEYFIQELVPQSQTPNLINSPQQSTTPIINNSVHKTPNFNFKDCTVTINMYKN